MPISHNDIFIVVSDVVLNRCILILSTGGQITALTVRGINSSSSEGIYAPYGKGTDLTAYDS